MVTMNVMCTLTTKKRKANVNAFIISFQDIDHISTKKGRVTVKVHKIIHIDFLILLYSMLKNGSN